jgi:hypothetical protein
MKENDASSGLICEAVGLSRKSFSSIIFMNFALLWHFERLIPHHSLSDVVFPESVARSMYLPAPGTLSVHLPLWLVLLVKKLSVRIFCLEL